MAKIKFKEMDRTIVKTIILLNFVFNRLKSLLKTQKHSYETFTSDKKNWPNCLRRDEFALLQSCPFGVLCFLPERHNN